MLTSWEEDDAKTGSTGLTTSEVGLMTEKNSGVDVSF